MTRKPIIAGNWKMYKTISQAIELSNGLKRELYKVDPDQIDIVLCPPYTTLTEVAEVLLGSNMKLGAQDMYWEDEGAFTGEISGLFLKDAGVKYVIIGHSERRQFFHETNETVNKKLKAALRHELTPIVCVGENLSEREKNKTFDVVKDHVENSLKDVGQEEALKLVLAYEPVWAIGTGKTATPAQAQEVQKFIRDLLVKMYNNDTAQAIRIQYGGSVKPENAAELMKQPDIDGALVGGASLKIDSFAAIINNSIGAKR